MEYIGGVLIVTGFILYGFSYLMANKKPMKFDANEEDEEDNDFADLSRLIKSFIRGLAMLIGVFGIIIIIYQFY